MSRDSQPRGGGYSLPRRTLHRDPRAADRVRVELYEGLGHLEAASDERLYSAALEWLAPSA